MSRLRSGPSPHRLPPPAALLVAVALVTAAPAAAQSVLDRPPNLGGTWTGASGTLHFNFLHRFADTGPPLRKVVNYPTFLLGAGLPGDLMLGARYSSNSELVAAIPNEWEFFGRWAALTTAGGAPLDATVHVAFNEAARSLDGELTVAGTFGERLRVMAAARGFSNAFGDESRGAWAAGATLRLTRHVALAADVARLFDLADREGEAAWSAGLQLAVPFTPHSLSLHASNATTVTLQGSSLGVPETRWGFEFTVPITLSRYFGDRVPAPPGDAPVADVAAVVDMTDRLRFTRPQVTVRVGQTVRWTNGSAVVHTVTADPALAADPSVVILPDGAVPFDSGRLVPGATFEHTFTVPGRYRYVCLPHEAAGMVGTVVVEGRAR